MVTEGPGMKKCLKVYRLKMLHTGNAYSSQGVCQVLLYAGQPVPLMPYGHASVNIPHMHMRKQNQKTWPIPGLLNQKFCVTRIPGYPGWSVTIDTVEVTYPKWQSQSQDVREAGNLTLSQIKVMILLPQPPRYWDYRYVPPCLPACLLSSPLPSSLSSYPFSLSFEELKIGLALDLLCSQG